MDWTGVINNPVFSGNGNVKIYGSMILSANIDWDFYDFLKFMSTDTGNIVFSGGTHLPCWVMFEGGGTWTLMDSLSMAYGAVVLIKGTLNTNDKTIRCTTVEMDNGPEHRILNLGQSEIYCTNWYSFDTTLVNVYGASSRITCYNMWAGGYQAYGDVIPHDLHAENCIFHDATFPNGGALYADTCNFNKVVFYGNATLGSHNDSISKLTVVNGDLIILNHIVDTLDFFGPGHSITLDVDTFQATGFAERG